MSAQDFFAQGLQAYRDGQFGEAINQFLQGLGVDKNHWEMRLYLGMSYARLGNTREAKQEFLSVRDFSIDPELRRKANAALNAMSPTASQQSVPKVSGR